MVDAARRRLAQGRPGRHLASTRSSASSPERSRPPAHAGAPGLKGGCTCRRRLQRSAGTSRHSCAQRFRRRAPCAIRAGVETSGYSDGSSPGTVAGPERGDLPGLAVGPCRSRRSVGCPAVPPAFLPSRPARPTPVRPPTPRRTRDLAARSRRSTRSRRSRAPRRLESCSRRSTSAGAQPEYAPASAAVAEPEAVPRAVAQEPGEYEQTGRRHAAPEELAAGRGLRAAGRRTTPFPSTARWPGGRCRPTPHRERRPSSPRSTRAGSGVPDVRRARAGRRGGAERAAGARVHRYAGRGGRSGPGRARAPVEVPTLDPLMGLPRAETRSARTCSRSRSCPSRCRRRPATAARRPSSRSPRTTSARRGARRDARPRRLRPAPHRRRPADDPRSTASSRRSTTSPSLTPPVLQRVLYAILTQKQREKFEKELELDFAYSLPGQRPVPRERLPAARLGRRGVPADPVRDQDARGARRPAGGRELRRRCRAASCSSPGPTGSGKSTTLAVAGRPGQPHPRATTS